MTIIIIIIMLRIETITEAESPSGQIRKLDKSYNIKRRKKMTKSKM